MTGDRVAFHTEAAARRYPLRRFPFLIFFRETDSGIEVVAVTHARRRPGYWRERDQYF